jgi:hypothetical protein
MAMSIGPLVSSSTPWLNTLVVLLSLEPEPSWMPDGAAIELLDSSPGDFRVT